jgi:recombination protein U
VRKLRNHANRGQYLEEWIERTNSAYMQRGLAIITKIPTPWKILRTYNPYTKQYKITNAFPEKKSTVDFGGTACNQSVWFDVKSTQNKTRYPLANIYGHQREYLLNVAKQGGKAFILIHSTVLKKTWLLWIDQLIEFITEDKAKSLSFEWLNSHCEVVKSRNGVILDYLPLVLKRKEDKP